MSNIHPDYTGGQAFPCGYGDHREPHGGMTLRDYFAGQALAGISVDTTTTKPICEWDWSALAKAAYIAADAMLAARAGGAK